MEKKCFAHLRNEIQWTINNGYMCGIGIGHSRHNTGYIYIYIYKMKPP